MPQGKAEEQDGLISILQEESNNLKARMIQLTEENNKFKKENNMLK